MALLGVALMSTGVMPERSFALMEADEPTSGSTPEITLTSAVSVRIHKVSASAPI